MSYSGNLYLPNFVIYNKDLNKIVIDESVHNFRKEFLENKTHKNTYIVFYGDYNYFFEKRLKVQDDKIIEYETPELYSLSENISLNYETRKILLKEKIKESLESLSKNKKILLLYPSPISPVNILDHIKINKNNIIKDKNFFLKDKINYSKNFFRKYNSEIINFFNNLRLKNIYRIQLEEIFCPKDRCTFYDDKHTFIFDKAHPSYEGSKKINDLIMKEIKRIDLKSN